MESWVLGLKDLDFFYSIFFIKAGKRIAIPTADRGKVIGEALELLFDLERR
jgi:hypothetical protein